MPVHEELGWHNAQSLIHVLTDARHRIGQLTTAEVASSRNSIRMSVEASDVDIVLGTKVALASDIEQTVNIRP